MLKILILGGAGFIGRHIAAALAARGHRLEIGSRRPRRAVQRLSRLGCGAFVEVHFEDLVRPDDWAPVLRGADVVVNAVGILRERGRETYEKVHCDAPKALAAACAARGIRLIHISALGLHAGARSRFLTSKLFGEAALMTSEADYTIVRPSLLDGDDGFGSRWLRAVARMPIHLVPACSTGRIAALHVDDLGEAVATLCEPGMPRRVVELGGARARPMAGYLAALRAVHTEVPAFVIRIPAWLARIASHLFDLLHFSPLSYGHLELMERDNTPSENLLPALLGRAPTAVGTDAPAKRRANPVLPAAAGRA